MKRIFTLLLAAFAVVGLVACEPTTQPTKTQPTKSEPKVTEKWVTQGLTAEKIVIGNTAATSGLFAGVGIPFNLAMKAVFDEYNENTDGPKIEFKHYDDGFVGETGLAYTRKLVEEDEVFALVGHFGTNTVEATMDYLLESGIPMVYGVTGVNSLYFDNEPGNNILSVQPIYFTEGRMMVARGLHEALFGAEGNAKISENAKIAVLFSEDDAGLSIKAGIEAEMAAQGIAPARVQYISFEDADAEAKAQQAINGNPEIILLSANQAPATAMATALRVKGSTVPVLSSYVNAAGVFTPAMVEGQDLPFEVYANAWVDINEAGAPAPTEEQIGGDGTLDGYAFPLSTLPGFTAEYWEFVRVLNDSDLEDGDYTTKALWANPYAMAGYVAAKAFTSLLDRVEDFSTLTWESFIALAEAEVLPLPLAGSMNWADGNRYGLDTLALTRLQKNTFDQWEMAKVREVESIDEVLAK